MKKMKLRDLFIVAFSLIFLFLAALLMAAVGHDNSMFAPENIKEISLFFIIGFPIAYIIKKYFLKWKG